MQQRYIRIAQLASTPTRPGRVPASQSTIWRWSASGTFPAPHKLSAGITAWLVEDVERWEAGHRVAGAVVEGADPAPARPLSRRQVPVPNKAAPNETPVRRGPGRPRKFTAEVAE